MENYEIDLAHKAFIKVNELINNASPKLMSGDRNDLTIYVPKYFKSLLEKYFKSAYNYTSPDPMIGDDMVFQGIKVEIGYDNKLVIAHYRSPEFPDLKTELPL